MGKKQQSKRRRNPHNQRPQHDWMKAVRRQAKYQSLYDKEYAETLQEARAPRRVMKENRSQQAEIDRLHTTLIELNEENREHITEKMVLRLEMSQMELRNGNLKQQLEVQHWKMLQLEEQLKKAKFRKNIDKVKGPLIGWTIGTAGVLMGWLLIQLGHSL